MILEEIKKANMQALKDKDQNARAVYSVLMTKAMLETVKKREKKEEFSDSDMSNILQKTLKELDEEKANYEKANNSLQAQNIEKQKNIIAKFLPKLLGEDEIKKLIMAQNDKSLPSIMKFFKQNYAGKVDMAKVAEVLKKI